MGMGRAPIKPNRWPEVLEYINTKRTHEPAFRALFKEIMDKEDDPCHQQLRTLSMLYDFTPIHPIQEKEIEDNCNDH